MLGLGVIVNVAAVFVASVAGLFLKDIIERVVKKEKIENISNTIMSGLALCIICIGMSGALKSENTLICIVSMVVGAFIGEILDLDKGLINLGNKIEEKLKNKNSKISNSKDISIAQGFVSASLLFCVGAMAVVGSLNSGLFGDNEILFAKSALDGVSAFLFTITMGIGVLFSAVAIFLYEGSITIGAFLLKELLSDPVITEMNAVGSLMILAIGFNMILKSNIKVANLLPAMFIPIIFGIFGMI